MLRKGFKTTAPVFAHRDRRVRNELVISAPAVGSGSVISTTQLRLTLGELEFLTRFRTTWLFTLNHASIAGQESKRT